MWRQKRLKCVRAEPLQNLAISVQSALISKQKLGGHTSSSSHSATLATVGLTDEDGIRTHACRAQWISSPSPSPLGHLVRMLLLLLPLLPLALPLLLILLLLLLLLLFLLQPQLLPLLLTLTPSYTVCHGREKGSLQLVPLGTGPLSRELG